MTRSLWFPGANLSQTFDVSGREMRTVNTFLFHTTEGRSWPGYSGNFPTLTYHPKEHVFRQHCMFNFACMALRDLPGGVRPNWNNVAQIEVIGTSGWNAELAAAGWHIKDIDQQAIDDLGRLVGWSHSEWEVPLTSIQPWSHPRLSFDEWTNFYGVLGHQHVPENDHSDPGNLIPIDRIMAAAVAGVGGGTGAGGGVPSGTVTPPPPPPPAATYTVSIAHLHAAMLHDVAAPNGVFSSYRNEVDVLQSMLQRVPSLGYSPYQRGFYGTTMVKAVKRLQGWWPYTKTPDGWLGMQEMTRLVRETMPGQVNVTA